jgi:hypothetical protein
LNSPVAPRAGAWVETVVDVTSFLPFLVAPRAGAWVETIIVCSHQRPGIVAPRAGAWVETYMLQNPSYQTRRRTPCGCVG